MHLWHALLICAVTLAGCAGMDPETPQDQLPTNDTRPADGEGPQQDQSEDIQEGLHLSGVLSPCEFGWCLDLLAENEGSETYHVSDMCVTPWSERMDQHDHAVQHRQPMAHCMAFGTAPFSPGASNATTLTWNETLWDDDQGKYVLASGGTYTWYASFQAFKEADGGEALTAEVAFAIVLLD